MTRILLGLAALASIVTFSTISEAAELGMRRAKKVTANIYRGPRPDEADFEEMARAGVRTVIDLQGGAPTIIPGESQRARKKRKEIAEGLGLRLVNIPTTLSRVNEPKEQAELLKVVELMNDPRNQPVYVHCAAGRDRTGVAVALYRILYQGCSYDKARRELVKSGLPIWTPALMAKQFAFLREMEAKQLEITGALNERCPL